MLVLGRREMERVVLTLGDVRIVVAVVKGQGEIRLGFDAPPEVKIVREEIMEQTAKESSL